MREAEVRRVSCGGAGCATWRDEAVGIASPILLDEILLDECGGLGGEVGVVAASGQPVDIGFFAKPGDLAFSVVAMGLAGGCDGFGLGDFAAKDGAGLSVAEGVKGAGGFSVLGDEGAGLCDEAGCEHGFRAGVDAVVERGTGRVEADAEDAIAGQRVSPGGPGAGERLAGGEADFDGADEFGVVVGVNARGCGGIEPVQQAMEPAGWMLFRAAAQAVAEIFRALRSLEEAVEESAEVESGAAGDDGEMAAG